MPNIDLGGNTVIVDHLKVGATAPGQTGTDISTTEISYLGTVIAGTAQASKAVVLGASKDIATITSATITTLTSTTIAGGPSFTTTPILATGTTVDTANSPFTCTGTGGTSTCTMTEYVGQITTASITTAGGATHVITV